MPLITKPDFSYIWASGGAVVAPNDSKKQLGWVAEAPPFQYDNWLQNRQDQMLAHINQRGIAAWDALTNYEAGGLSYVQGSDGKIYKSVAASGPSATVQNPTTDDTDTYWTVAFADVGAFLTQAAGDTRYTQRANNLSDVTNVATARNNLGAAPTVSPAFTGAPTAPTASPETSTTQLATTAFVTTANNLKANINSPTFTGVPSAPTATAGTRSTAIATMQNFANEFGSSLAANGYQKLPSGLIIQWGSFSSGVTSYSFPIAFPTAFLSISCMQAGTTSSSIARIALLNTPTTSGFTTASIASNMLPAYWTAIGH